MKKTKKMGSLSICNECANTRQCRWFPKKEECGMYSCINFTKLKDGFPMEELLSERSLSNIRKI